jgi:hypothetical protein
MGFETTDQHGDADDPFVAGRLARTPALQIALPDLCKDKKNTRAACWDGS